MLKKFFSAAIALVFISGCATVMDGKTQEVTIQTTPVGAEILVNGVVKGVTPLTLHLQRADNTSLTARKEGYEDQTITMATKVNPKFFGNILIGGLPGSTTDLATGAATEYAPGNHHFILTAK